MKVVNKCCFQHYFTFNNIYVEEYIFYFRKLQSYRPWVVKNRSNQKWIKTHMTIRCMKKKHHPVPRNLFFIQWTPLLTFVFLGFAFMLNNFSVSSFKVFYYAIWPTLVPTPFTNMLSITLS